MPEDYSKGKIYKLTAGDLTYYGSTAETLNDRFSKHKYDAKRNVCITSKKLFDSGEEVKIHLIENYPCNSKVELEDREAYFIRNFECVNERIPRRNIQEWRENNREHLLEQMKQYRKNHKEDLAEYFKQYHKNNREVRLEKQKQYREANKDKINAHRSEKIECECGAVVCRGDIIQHRKTQKHKKYIDSL